MAKKKDKSYWENVIQEIGEFRRARNTANDAEHSDWYDRNIANEPQTAEEIKRYVRGLEISSRRKGEALREEKAERGQLLGAVLQGRRYGKSGKQKKK